MCGDHGCQYRVSDRPRAYQMKDLHLAEATGLTTHWLCLVYRIGPAVGMHHDFLKFNDNSFEEGQWINYIYFTQNIRAWLINTFLNSFICHYVSCSFIRIIFISVDKKNQLDATFCILYFSSNSCSTCFGQPRAHHQELTTAWCYSLVLVCAVAAGRLSILLFSLFLF